MELLLHKLLPIVLLPIGLTLALLALAWWRKSRRFIAAAMAWLWLVSMPCFSDLVLEPLENAYPALELVDCPEADAIVVLSGIQHQGPLHSLDRVEWSSGVDRFEEGLRLALAGRAPLLIFTGGKVPWQELDSTEGDNMQKLAIARGLIPDRVLVAGVGAGNTAAEADAIAKLAAEKNLRRIVLVTSAFHMSRAMLLFERKGFQVTPYPVDYRSHFESSRTVLYWLPAAEAVRNVEIALREYYGLAWYKLVRRR